MHQVDVSIILPWIREDGYKRCVDAILNNAGVSSGVYEIVSEYDEYRIGVPMMVKKLTEKSNGRMVMFLADDTIPQPDFLVNAIEAMKGIKDGWGLVGLNDGIHNGDILATHWLADKRLLDFIGGEFFHVGYLHCFCDDELIARAKDLDKYVWCKKARLIHDHPMFKNWDGIDDDYKRVYSLEYWDHDLELFKKRRLNGWRG